jgi:hypothetical protein
MSRIVTVSATTTYLTTETATKAALVVGQCAVATGSSDSTGTVSATRVAVSPPQNGTCTAGFGRRGGSGGFGGDSAGGGTSGTGGTGG